MKRNKYGIYFGANYTAAEHGSECYQVFSRWGQHETLPGWKHAVPLVGNRAVDHREYVAVIDELIRDLEQLKKWKPKRCD